MSRRVYELNSKQSLKLTHDVHANLTNVGQNMIAIKGLDLKVLYMSEDGKSICSAFPPTQKQLTKVLNELISGSYVIQETSTGVKTYKLGSAIFPQGSNIDFESSESHTSSRNRMLVIGC